MSILDLLHVVAFFTLGMWLVYGVAFPDTDPYYGDLSLEPNARSIYPARGALPEPFPIEGTTRSIQLYYFPNPHKFLQKLLDVNAIVACAMLFADKIKNLETEERPPSSALGAIGTGERISPSDPRCGSVNLFFGRAFGQEITLAQAQWSLRAIAQASLEKNSHGNYKFNEEARIVSCIVLRRQSLQLVPIEMDEVDPLDNDVPATNGQANRTDLVL